MKRHTFQRTSSKARAGFSLAELMVVIVIIGLLATLVVPKVVSRLFVAQTGKAKADIVTIAGALEQYAIDNGGVYPDSLESLVTADENGISYLNMERIPVDPWNNEYRYEPPSGGQPAIVGTYGKDGVPGGEGDDRDFDNVMIRNGEF